MTYTNTDYGFTIKYPSDWIVDYKNTSKYGLNTTNFKSPDGFGSIVVMVGIGNGTGMSFDNMSMYYSHHPITPGGRLLEFIPNNYFLSGHPAFRSIEINSFGPSEVTVPFDTKMMTFFTTLGGKAYFVAYAALLERFPDYLQTAQTMINSFQIINKQ